MRTFVTFCDNIVYLEDIKSTTVCISCHLITVPHVSSVPFVKEHRSYAYKFIEFVAVKYLLLIAYW